MTQFDKILHHLFGTLGSVLLMLFMLVVLAGVLFGVWLLAGIIYNLQILPLLGLFAAVVLFCRVVYIWKRWYKK